MPVAHYSRTYYVEILDIVPVYNFLVEIPNLLLIVCKLCVFFVWNKYVCSMLPSWSGLSWKIDFYPNATITWLHKGVFVSELQLSVMDVGVKKR